MDRHLARCGAQTMRWVLPSLMELPFLAGKTHRHKIGMEVRAMKKTWGRQNDGKGGDWGGVGGGLLKGL